MMTIDVEAEYQQLATFFDEAAAFLDDGDNRLFARVPEVSGWSVAQQLFHSWKAGGQMLKAALMLYHGRGPIDHDADGPNRIGRIVLTRGRFPRGEAQAPAALVPPEELTRAELQMAAHRSHATFESLNGLLPSLAEVPGRFAHPYFGPLTATEWVRAARIHSDHHLAIIQDIVREAGV